MSVWKIMEGAGRIRKPTSLLAGYNTNIIKTWCRLLDSHCNNKLKQSFCFLFFVQDTFRGRVCECPTVQGVKFMGDGYTKCEGKCFHRLPCRLKKYAHNSTFHLIQFSICELFYFPNLV